MDTDDDFSLVTLKRGLGNQQYKAASPTKKPIANADPNKIKI